MRRPAGSSFWIGGIGVLGSFFFTIVSLSCAVLQMGLKAQLTTSVTGETP